jgi:hypothetical protein
MASTSLLQLIADSAEPLTVADEAAARGAFDVIVRFVAAGLEGVCRTA